jgi:acetyl-CoA C-acetyltransferase
VVVGRAAADRVTPPDVVKYPLTHYIYCSPYEGVAVVVFCRADIAYEFKLAPMFVRTPKLWTRRYGAFEVTSP